MRVRTLILAALSALFVLGAVAPAFAHNDWRRHEYRERQYHALREDAWRQHAWREHAWRQRAWREHAWRERAWREWAWRERQPHFAPPMVVVPPRAYGYYVPPPVYYPNPGYRRW
jgi:hypothetical protein